MSIVDETTGRLNEATILVFLEEEYGYRNWAWMPDMSAAELKEWWKAMPTVAPYFFSGPVDFPGDVHQIYIDEEGFWMVQEADGRVLEPISAKFLLDNGPQWRAHIHQDNDSYLVPPGEDAIFHAGYVTDEEYYSDDYQSPQEVQDAWDMGMIEQVQKIIAEE